jgi:hypothetical protein
MITDEMPLYPPESDVAILVLGKRARKRGPGEKERKRD